MVYTKEKHALVNLETCDITCIFDEGSRITARTKAQDKAWKEIQEKKACDTFFKDYQVNELGGFVFMQYNNITTLTEQYGVPLQDIPKLIYLSSFLSYKTNILKTDDGQFMTKKSMLNILGISRNTFNKFFNFMIEKNILMQEKDKILINPEILSKGEIITNKYKTKIFISSIRYLYENTDLRQHKNLGLVYQLMPYVNKYNSGICLNPLEDDFDNIQPITTKEICKILGVSLEGKNSKNITRIKKSLTNIKLKDGTSIIANVKISTRKHSVWLVNPKVISNHVEWKRFEIVYNLFFSMLGDKKHDSVPHEEKLPLNDFVVWKDDEGYPLIIRDNSKIKFDEEEQAMYIEREDII